MGKLVDILHAFTTAYKLSEKKKTESQNTPDTPAHLNVREMSVTKSPYYDNSQYAPYNPALLYQRRQSYSLYDEIKHDDVVDSLLEYKKNLIVGSACFVDSPDEKIRDFWDVSLYQEFEGNLISSLFEIMSCLDYGFSLTEIIHKPIKYNSKTYWGLKNLKTRPPQSINLHTDIYGNLENITQHGSEGELINLDPDNFLLYTHRREFGNPYGRSDFSEGVYRSVFSKKMIVKFMNIALERFSVPFTVGTHPETDDPKDLDEFYNALKNLSAKATMTKSEKYSVEFLESKRNITMAFMDALNFYNLSIARAFLISDLMGISGKQMASGGLGGGLGDVQFEVMIEIFRRYRTILCELINNRIVRPLTKFNFGDKAEAFFRINDLTKDEKYKALTKFLEYLKTPGANATDEQRRWIAEILGVPVGEQEEEEEDGDDENNDLLEDDVSPNDDPDEKKPEPEPEPKKTEAKENFAEFVPLRELTGPEKKVNFAQADRKIEEAVKKHVTALEAGMNKIVMKIFETIKNKKMIEKKRFDLINKMSVSGKGVLNNVFTDLINESFASGKTSVQQEEAQIKMAYEADVDIATAEVIRHWKHSKIVYLTKTLERDIRDVLEPQLTEAMRSGATLRETTREIGKSLTAKLSAARLEMIARTNIMSAYNQGRLQQFKKVSDMRGLQWSAILDGEACDLCAKLDGKIMRMSEADDWPMPAHPNCRCMHVSVHTDDVREKNENEIYGPMPAVEKRDGFIRLAKAR